jgi:hypothetical protein
MVNNTVTLRLATGILFIILGLLIALGPYTIFPVCGEGLSNYLSPSSQESTQMNNSMAGSSNQSSMSSTSMTMKCHWTAQAELGIGFVIVVLGILLIVFSSGLVRLGLSLSLVPVGILALLIPNTLIGICDNVHMNCHAETLPALTILSGILIIAAAAYAVYLYLESRKGQAN